MVTATEKAAVRPPDLWRCAAFALRLGWRADRGSLVTLVVVHVGAALGLGIGLLVLRTVLGGAVSGGLQLRAPGGSSVLAGLAVLAAVRTAGGIFGAVTTARQRVLSARVDRHVNALVLRAAVRTELPRFEDPGFHDRLQRAVFASRAQPVVVIATLVAVLQALLTTVAVSAVFAVMAWWLLPFAALAALPTMRAARDERDARYGLHHDLAESRRVRLYFERLMTGQDEAKEVRVLDLGPLLEARWDAEYEREIGETVRTQRHHLRRKIAARLGGDLLIVAVAGTVWWLMGSGFVDLPTALAALTGLWLLSTRLQMVGRLAGNIGEAVLFLKDLRVFAESGGSGESVGLVGSGAGGRPARGLLAPDVRCLRAERIDFTYPGSTRPALHDVSVTLGAGEIVALVGPNGSGKTTLAKLLAGLYRPDAGELLLNDGPVDPAVLRVASAVLFQDFVRYKLSGLDNIAFGRADRPADLDRVVRSARAAGAHDFLAGLPREYATVLSKEFTAGEDLSGGQWQRLALARAFYRNAPLVILDEPTAALDPEAEEELFRHIRRLFAGRTVLLISHRFSSVRGADRIYVLDRGAVIEQGTHDDLMARRGRYAELFRTQASGYLDPPTVTGAAATCRA